MAFELAPKRGAALITKHPTYREDIEREATFESYIKRHYNSWIEFARWRGDGEDIQPVLVTGVDLTREFATVAYSRSRTRMRCEFSATVPDIISTSASVWGSWRTWGSMHTNCGPHPTQGSRNWSESPAHGSGIPDEYTQCVFIRYYTIRKRFFFPTIIKAGAGPHQLPKRDHEDDDGPLVLPTNDSTEAGAHYSGTRDSLDEEIYDVCGVHDWS